jgi:hypothetical protein
LFVSKLFHVSVSANAFTTAMTIVMSEVKSMDEKTKIIVAATILVLAAIALGVAVANAYYASTRPANPYRTYGNYEAYGSNYPPAGVAPQNPYGSYGTLGPYGYGYGYGNSGLWGGGMGMGRMGGGFGMGMMR